jgi:hypothetical protein
MEDKFTLADEITLRKRLKAAETVCKETVEWFEICLKTPGTGDGFRKWPYLLERVEILRNVYTGQKEPETVNAPMVGIQISERLEAAEALADYAEHEPDCKHEPGSNLGCTCGMSEALDAWQKAKGR